METLCAGLGDYLTMLHKVSPWIVLQTEMDLNYRIDKVVMVENTSRAKQLVSFTEFTGLFTQLSIWLSKLLGIITQDLWCFSPLVVRLPLFIYFLWTQRVVSA